LTTIQSWNATTNAKIKGVESGASPASGSNSRAAEKYPTIPVSEFEQVQKVSLPFDSR
jgi:hypothetical protein